MKKKDKPRIAYLLQMFGIGGMPKWLYSVAVNLQDQFDFYFIATHSNYFIPEYRSVAQVVHIPFKKWILTQYLRLHQIDLVQMANHRLYADAALAARVPVVIERTDGLRGGVALNPKHGLDAVIASTKGTISHIEKLIDKDKIHLIYNGVDIERFEKVEPERFGFSPEDIIIGRISRLVGGKYLSLLIQSVINLRKDPAYQHVRLVICGGDTTQSGSHPMLEKYKKQAAQLGDSAVFTGEVFDPYPIIKGFDIATCTSLPGNEGIPNSLIEPMAAGKPVVSTDVDDIPELVIHGENGLLVPSNNLPEFTAALKTMVDNGEMRRKYGAAARACIERDYNLYAQVAKYKDLYYRLLTQKGCIF